MMLSLPNYYLALYFTPMVLIWAAYVLLKRRGQQKCVREKQASIDAGLIQPPSLHPVFNPHRCIGCGSCVEACPEHRVIGLIDKKAELINPSHCIGHGACKTACPMDAITLVFGTAERGVDIPHVKTNFETNVPGIFIAGELGGMGLVRNAIEQGRQAIQSISEQEEISGGDKLDVIIVGAGPAGFSATLNAKQQGLRSITIEQDTLGGTVSHFPRGKLVMTSPVQLPLYGKMGFSQVTKEELVEFWKKVERETGVSINYRERVESITRAGFGFSVTTSNNSYRTRTVLLCIGRNGTPRKLGVPGEENPKVVYRLVDPEQYRNKRVLVVGGGDSALEAAASIAEVGSEVTLSYRAGAFSRAKEKNRNRVSEAEANGRLKVLFNSNVKHIETDSVRIIQDEQEITLPNDAIIVNAGGILPTAFLKSMGIQVETKYGTA